MTRNEIANVVKKTIIKHLQLNKDFFEQYENGGEQLYLSADLGADMLDKFEILSKVESKCGILVNDGEVIWQEDITIAQYIDAIFKETKKNIRKFRYE